MAHLECLRQETTLRLGEPSLSGADFALIVRVLQGSVRFAARIVGVDSKHMKDS